MQSLWMHIKWLCHRIGGGKFYGSNRLSLILRMRIERISTRQVLGVNLAGLAFFAAVVLPQTGDLASQLQVALQTRQTYVPVVASEAKFQWPMPQFGISQSFAVWHPGIDLTNPIGTPVFPIAAGRVMWVKTLPYGYGNHILVDNGEGVQSLYAHLSKINVSQYDDITKGTVIGEVGVTGRSTGSHLHLEVYQNNTPINPMEVLPAIGLIK